MVAKCAHVLEVLHRAAPPRGRVDACGGEDAGWRDKDQLGLIGEQADESDAEVEGAAKNGLPNPTRARVQVVADRQCRPA